MGNGFEDLGEEVPAMVPLTTDFEDAILEIKEPVRALAESIMHMGVVGGKDEVLIPVAATIRNFLAQLDYVLQNAYVGEKSIMFSEIHHLFTVKALAKSQEEESDGGAQ
jgi:hypothetical protein